MKSKFIGLFFFIFTLEVSSQTSAFNYVHTLDSVSFEDVSGNYIEITEDIIQPGNPTQVTFVAPHFTPAMSTPHPVAYVSGTKPKVKAVFSTTCPNTFYIRGRTNFLIEDDFIFASQQVTPSGGVATYIAEADISFENFVIKCYDEFAIDWEMSDDESSWTSIGQSTNRLYVTHNAPDPTLTTVYHTVIDVSCHKAGGNNGPNEDIVDEIWEEAFEKSFLGYFQA